MGVRGSISHGNEEQLVKIAKRQVVLLEAKEVAELVEIGGANFLHENVGISPGEVPEVVQIKDDPRRRIGGNGIRFKATGTLKKAQQVRFEPLFQDGPVRHGLVKRGDRFRGGAQLARKTGADAADAFRGKSMEVGIQDF